MTDAPPPSSLHFDKDSRGRWVLLFGHYNGKRLAEVPSSYLRWMLNNCRFVRGPFRTSAQRVLQQRYDGLAEEPDGSPGDWTEDLTDEDVRESVGLGPSDEQIEDAEWFHDEGVGDR